MKRSIIFIIVHTISSLNSHCRINNIVNTIFIRCCRYYDTHKYQRSSPEEKSLQKASITLFLLLFNVHPQQPVLMRKKALDSFKIIDDMFT